MINELTLTIETPADREVVVTRTFDTKRQQRVLRSIGNPGVRIEHQPVGTGHPYARQALSSA